jgi:hypothetical protein
MVRTRAPGSPMRGGVRCRDGAGAAVLLPTPSFDRTVLNRDTAISWGAVRPRAFAIHRYDPYLHADIAVFRRRYAPISASEVAENPADGVWIGGGWQATAQFQLADPGHRVAGVAARPITLRIFAPS